MKFFNFSELGSCCRPQGTPAPAAAPEESGSHASGSPASASKRNGKCSTSTKKASAAHWRPELPAISEDGLVASVLAGKSKPMVQKKSPIKGGSTSTAKTQRYSSTDGSKDSGKNSVPVNVIIPTFSPTPFVF